MIKFFFLHVIVGLFLSLNAMDWYDDYDIAHQKALKENKIFYVFIVSENCRWCHKMQETTMQDKDIIAQLSKDFIAVELIRGFDDYPEILQANMVPKHYFLTPNEKKLYALPGYWDAEDFRSILDDVVKKFKKFKAK